MKRMLSRGFCLCLALALVLALLPVLPARAAESDIQLELSYDDGYAFPSIRMTGR